MLAFTHLLFGILAGQLLKNYFTPESSLIYYAAICFAALLPDIDHAGSTINRIFTITKIVPWFFKHRGFFHSIWPAIILSALAWQFSNDAATGLAIGYLSHLVSDSITQAGVNWLYPLLKFQIKGPVRTGGFVETIVCLGLIIGIGVVVLH